MNRTTWYRPRVGFGSGSRGGSALGGNRRVACVAARDASAAQLKTYEVNFERNEQ